MCLNRLRNTIIFACQRSINWFVWFCGKQSFFCTSLTKICWDPFHSFPHFRKGVETVNGWEPHWMFSFAGLKERPPGSWELRAEGHLWGQHPQGFDGNAFAKTVSTSWVVSGYDFHTMEARSLMCHFSPTTFFLCKWTDCLAPVCQFDLGFLSLAVKGSVQHEECRWAVRWSLRICL